MIIDASRGEIQLDDLFCAIEQDKDQVSQALDLYSNYLKVKNDQTITGEKKIEILEDILKLECIEKTNVNHNNHENERSRINLKWNVLTECGIWTRKLSLFDKAIKYFEQANLINNRVSTIYYEMAMCYLELGNIYQLKICLEKTIEISHEHTHWKCLEQIISLYFLLGNYSKCLEYIRIGYDRVATYQSIYDFGEICLVLLEKYQPSMKYFIEKLFPNEIDRSENMKDKVEDLDKKLKLLKEKLFAKKIINQERKSLEEKISIDNFQDFGQYLMKKIRDCNGDHTKLCKLIEIKHFLPKTEQSVRGEEKQAQPMDVQEEEIVPAPSQPVVNRKKRSCLPLNIDDYEKRRSARSITRMISDDNNISTMEKLKRILSNDESSSDEENDETVISPDNADDDLAPTLLSDLPKETYPSLQIDYLSFLHSIETKISNGYQYHYLDFIQDYINELIKHSSTLWSTEIRMIFTKFFDCLLDHIQYSSTEIDSNHIRACLCYVENALGSTKSDLSEDSIERFSCFARLKIKYKSLGYCFGKLQFYLYLFKNSSIQQKQFDIDDRLYRILWISSLYYFLSDVQDDALACIHQLSHLISDNFILILPNLFNHTTISKSTIESLYLRLKNNETSTSSSSSQELTYILSRIAVAEEKDELALLIKKLDKKIKLFYSNLTNQIQLQQKSLIKCYETLVNVIKENQHLNEKENLNVRKIFDQIFVQIIDMIMKILNEDIQWRDSSLKTIEKLTLNLIDMILKRDTSASIWPFKSINPWILLYRVAMKRDTKRNEQFIVSYVRNVHELFGKHEECLIDHGGLLEYFLLEFIQIEHPDIRQRLFSNRIIETNFSSNDFDEQKSKLSKIMEEIEQCIYCLYGLVLRKSKMKYLNDHNCRSLELTLEKASIVFYALRPRQLPGYEGRMSIITNETECLFQRFESMIEWNDEREQRRKQLLTYISDTTSINSQGKQSEALIHLSDQRFQINNCLFENDLYYLFADYYLKMGSKDAATNESSKKKAQDYYIKDLCLNTRRFDSWAGLTVIEFYKIEEFITADDFDPRIFNVHMSASCFFRQAVSIETNNHTLWMEYAEITYILQAYCSKYKEKSLEYVPDRSFLLNICKEAYEKANLCTDNDENKEDWTYLYMMAKIEEKINRHHLFDALNKYLAALDLLHENKAVYPRKLGHQTSTSNSNGMLLGCHAVEMFYRIHASSLKYLNRYSKESIHLSIEKLNQLYEFLNQMQTKPFATSFYEKSNIPNDAHSAQLILELYFPHKFDHISDSWLTIYHKCIWLCFEGLYLCIVRYNRHYRGLYRLAHFFHTNEYYRNDRISLEFFLGGKILELKNYPKIIGLYQERSKHNLFNGIWRIQPLEAERTGSFNSSMYKCTRLLVDLLVQFDEQGAVLIEVLRQLLAKPDPEKKYLREVERKALCQHTIKNIYRTIKKKILLKTRDDIEHEGIQLLSTIEDNDTTTIPLPILFETAIGLYSLVKNYSEFYQNSRLDELVEFIFQRYRSILRYSSHLPERPKAESLAVIYNQKKPKPKVKRAAPTTTTEQLSANKRICVEHSTSQVPSLKPPTISQMEPGEIPTVSEIRSIQIPNSNASQIESVMPQDLTVKQVKLAKSSSPIVSQQASTIETSATTVSQISPVRSAIPTTTNSVELTKSSPPTVSRVPPVSQFEPVKHSSLADTNPTITEVRSASPANIQVEAPNITADEVEPPNPIVIELESSSPIAMDIKPPSPSVVEIEPPSLADIQVEAANTIVSEVEPPNPSGMEIELSSPTVIEIEPITPVVVQSEPSSPVVNQISIDNQESPNDNPSPPDESTDFLGLASFL